MAIVYGGGNFWFLGDVPVIRAVVVLVTCFY